MKLSDERRKVLCDLLFDHVPLVIYEDVVRFIEGQAEPPTPPVDEDGARWRALCEMAGYWQDSSSQTVKLYDDDATGEYFIQVGKRSYNGRSFNSAMDEARKGEGK